MLESILMPGEVDIRNIFCFFNRFGDEYQGMVFINRGSCDEIECFMGSQRYDESMVQEHVFTLMKELIDNKVLKKSILSAEQFFKKHDIGFHFIVKIIR
jgi:hypothetical protein